MRIAFGLLCTASASVALADLPGGGTLAFDELRIQEDGAFVTGTTEAVARYFNLSHCVCSSAGKSQPFQLRLSLTDPTGPSNRPGEFWFGPTCDNDMTRDTVCWRDDSLGITNVDTLVTPQRITLEVGRLIDPLGGACDPDSSDSERKVWFAVDGNGDASLDTWTQATIGVDTAVPKDIKEPAAASSENAVSLSWKSPDSSTDVKYYQALCADAAGAAVFSTAPFAARFSTANALCDVNVTESLSPVAATTTGSGPDAGGSVPSILTSLSKASTPYVCGESLGTETSMRISNLPNNVPVFVALLAVDAAGNASGVYFTSAQTPEPVTDFWEDIAERGGGIEGGFCLVAESMGNGPITTALRGFRDQTLARSSLGRWMARLYYNASAPLEGMTRWPLGRALLGAIALLLFAFALVWQLLGGPVALAIGIVVAMRAARLVRGATRRQPHGPRLVWPARLVAAAVLFSAQAAFAQQDPFALPLSEEAVDSVPRSWSRIGFKAGPYYPAIDEGLGIEPGPYASMFGEKARWIPHIEYDRFFLQPAGQLGLGVSMGLRWQNAKAYAAGTSPGDPLRPRSATDTNRFIMVPMTLTAVYRFTWLDDRFRVPLVPYVRGGLAYWAWWIKKPGGGNAVVYPGNCDPNAAGCNPNEASGGTLGYTASAGISLRAERLDSDAAWSMRDAGMEHAGFFAEINMMKVDGFGDETKMNLSDTAYLFGVDFEF